MAARKTAAPSPGAKVMLVHWKSEELPPRAKALQALGATVTTLSDPQAMGQMRAVRESGATAVVIDLGRLPAQGRELGMSIRLSPSTRHLPLIFVEGAADKVERVRATLPDAVFGAWATIAADFARAVAGQPAEPVKPPTGAAAYAGRTLVQKLGIKSGQRVALVNAPHGFDRALGDLPPEVSLRHSARGRAELAIWFVEDSADFRRGLPSWSRREDVDALWIAWRKKAKGVTSDLGENEIRGEGLAAGLVDYKVCAIDAVWSGLKFAWRGRAR